jgi:23S rRNA (guanosine2251-2'-O)-methyltransferase
VTSPRRRNDRPNRFAAGPDPAQRAAPGTRPSKPDPDAWVWGWHAVLAALANPARQPNRLLVAPDRARELEGKLGARGAKLRAEPMDIGDIGRQLPAGAAHQGVALRVAPPPSASLEALAEGGGLLVMLDQVTDPQNVGAVFRSAAAFGARGVILQDRNTPAIGGVIAKASAGAVDVVAHARVTNLSRALEQLAEAGFRAVGLDGSAELTLAGALDARPTVLVLGSEGQGLRRLVSEHCETLARIPMPGGFESLNVAAAAAVALYEASRAQAAG